MFIPSCLRRGYHKILNDSRIIWMSATCSTSHSIFAKTKALSIVMQITGKCDKIFVGLGMKTR